MMQLNQIRLDQITHSYVTDVWLCRIGVVIENSADIVTTAGSRHFGPEALIDVIDANLPQFIGSLCPSEPKGAHLSVESIEDFLVENRQRSLLVHKRLDSMPYVGMDRPFDETARRVSRLVWGVIQIYPTFSLNEIVGGETKNIAIPHGKLKHHRCRKPELRRRYKIPSPKKLDRVI